MTRSDFLAQLDELMGLQSGSLTGKEKLRDLKGWDSLKLIEVIALVDEQLDLTLVPDSLFKCQSVNDIIAMMADHLEG